MYMHTNDNNINTPCVGRVILLTVVAGITDETLDVWHTVVDLVNCCLTVVLTVLIVWVAVNVVVAGILTAIESDDDELNASVYNDNYEIHILILSLTQLWLST